MQGDIVKGKKRATNNHLLLFPFHFFTSLTIYLHDDDYKVFSWGGTLFFFEGKEMMMRNRKKEIKKKKKKKERKESSASGVSL